jgi:hypothetical protein
MRIARSEIITAAIVSFFELGMRFPNSTWGGKMTMTNWRPAALYRARIAVASGTIDV